MINNKNQKGYVLASVITLSALVFIVGSSALYMASMGSQTASSEIQYNKAKEASDLALNKAVLEVSKQVGSSTPNFVQTANKVKLNDSGAFYSYKTSPDSKNNNCFIYAEGITAGGSKVVQTVIVPIKPTDTDSLPSAVKSKNMVGFYSNANSKAIGNDCGGAGAMLQSPPTTTIKGDLEGDKGAEGNPDLRINPNMPNMYTSNFSDPSVINKATLDTYIDNQVTTKLQDSSIESKCKVDPPSTSLGSTDCTVSKQGKITCTGGSYSKTVDPSECTKTIIKARNIIVENDSLAGRDIMVSVSNDITLKGGVSGLWNAKNNIQINEAGSNKSPFDGIFIGAGTDNQMNIMGSTVFKGLFFVANSNPLVTPKLTVDTRGTSFILGSLQVDGNLDIQRKGNGNSSYPYDIGYNNQVINDWRDNYPGLLNEFPCDGTPPPKSMSAMITKTKMMMY